MISQTRDPSTQVPAGLAGLFERPGVYFLTFDLDGRIVDGNRTWAERFGPLTTDDQHPSLRDMVVPVNRAAVEDIFERLRLGATVTGVELCLAPPGCPPFPISGMISPVLEDGEAASAFGVLREQGPSDFSYREEAHPHFDAQLLDALVEFAPLGMMMTTENQEMLAWNRNFLELWGLDASVVHAGNGLAAAARIVEDPDPCFQTIESLTRDRERTAHGILRLTDGRSIDWSSASTWDRDGDFIGRAWYFSDSTINASVQAGLRRSEELYSQLVANFPDGVVFIFDDDLTFVVVDGAGLADFGLTRDSIQGRPVQEILPTRLFRQLEPAFQASLAGERATLDVRFYRRVFNVTSVPLDFDETVSGRHGMVIAREITEQMRLQDQLGEAEARLRSLVERIPAVTYVQQVKTTGNQTVYISPQVREIFGYRPDELIDGSVDWPDTIHPEDRKSVLEATEAANSSNAGFTMEYRTLTRDGDVRWVRDNASIILDEHGRVKFWQGVLSDITDERRLEEALRESESLFRSAFDDAATGIVIVGHEGRLIRANQAFCDMLGYTETEILAAGALRVFTHPEDVERDLTQFRRFRNREVDSYQSVKRFIHRDGDTVRVQLNVSFSYREDEEPVFIVAQAHDITEQHRLEEELRQSEEIFRNAFDHAAIGMARVALDGRLLDVNTSLCRMFGYDRDELLSMDFQTVTHPEDLDEDLNLVGRVLDGFISAYNIEKRYFHKNGGIVWGDLSVSLVRDEQGEPLFFISQIQDISQRKHLESRLEYLAHHDNLTGLLNRHGLYQAMDGKRGRESSDSVGVLMLDMDGFKEVNDTHGHAVGDQVLQEVARRLCASLREGDSIARVGGDEFVALLRGPIDREIASGIAARVEAAVREPIRLSPGTTEVRVSVSVGIEIGDGWSDESDLFRAADIAMYNAKRQRSAAVSD